MIFEFLTGVLAKLQGKKHTRKAWLALPLQFVWKEQTKLISNWTVAKNAGE